MQELIEAFRPSHGDDVISQRIKWLTESIEDGTVDVKKLNIRTLYEGLIGHEVPTYRLMQAGDNANRMLFEEVAAVRLSAFTDITGKIILDGVLSGYQEEALIMDQIFDVFTEKDDGGRWGGVKEMDDDVLEVKEGHEFPEANLTEDYVETPYSKKRGLRIGLTKEVLHFDKTGQLLNQARMVGQRVAVNRENRMIDVFIGVDNPYKRLGTLADTYLATGPRQNLMTGNELVDWTDVEAMLLKFADMHDDRAAPEPISVIPKTLLVMPGKEMTAKRILNATEIRHATNAGAIETISGNPLSNYQVMSSKRIYDRLQKAHVDQYNSANTYAGLSAADAAKVMFFGDFKRTFKYRTIFPLSVLSAGAEHPAFFDRDVLVQYRASERGVPFVVDPWYTLRSEG